MGFISFGDINKAFIPIIVGSIICFLNRLLNNYDGAKIFKHPIIINIAVAFAKLFGIIPLIILKKRSKEIFY